MQRRPRSSSMSRQSSPLEGPYDAWSVPVRGKHTGSPAQKKGPKRPTYQSLWREHPETARPIAETDIHAHHAEAFWRALRRQWAPCRSKTKTSATATTGWQRLLRGYGVVPHCLRVHCTTRAVPAVALGLLERRLSVQEMFQIQMAEAMISKGKTVPMKLNQCLLAGEHLKMTGLKI